MFLSFLALFFTLFLNAQTYKAINFPRKYTQPRIERDYSEAENDALSRLSRIWFVCSDRNNNKTYTTPSGKKVKKTLNFSNKFYVIGEKGEYLRLAKGKTGNMTDDIISQEDEIFINGIDYGWIHKRNLLLWRNCLIGENKMDMKAILMNKVEKNVSSSNVAIENLEEIAFYQDPNLTISFGNSTRLPEFNFFFIYKREGDAILLGKDSYIKDYYSGFKDILIGWVSAKKIIQWNHRVVAERNWEAPAVEERFLKDTKAAVFYKEFHAETYKKGYFLSDAHVLWQEKEISKQRDYGYRMRFPILKQQNGVLEVGVMGQIYNYDGRIDREEYEDIIQKTNVVKSIKRNINIVFVVDGTKGMQPYSKSISAAVQNSAKYFQSSSNTIKFGAVVYRDKDADPIIKRKELNTNPKAIIDFFNKEVNMNYEDTDVRDAVYHGIHAAINSLILNKEETNLIVLVSGSPNNSKTDIKEEELIQLMYDYNCHLFSFLVNNSSDEHEELIYQVRDLILGVAEKKYNKLKSERKIQTLIKKHLKYIQKPILVPYPKKHNMYRLERTATMGSIYHAEYGRELDPTSFQRELIDVLKKADIQINQFLSQVKYKILGIRSKESRVGTVEIANFGASFLDFLLSSNLSEEQISKIRDDNIRLYQTGYIPEFIDGHQYPLFKFSLFMTREELSELYVQMKKFSEATHSHKNARQEMQQIWLAILKSYIGSDEESFLKEQGIPNLLEMDLLTIKKKVYGIPIKSVFLKGVKLEDITNKDRFSDKQFGIFATRIEKKLQRLSSIVNRISYPYSFQSNDISYYWISEDLIP